MPMGSFIRGFSAGTLFCKWSLLSYISTLRKSLVTNGLFNLCLTCSYFQSCWLLHWKRLDLSSHQTMTVMRNTLWTSFLFWLPLLVQWMYPPGHQERLLQTRTDISDLGNQQLKIFSFLLLILKEILEQEPISVILLSFPLNTRN